MPFFTFHFIVLLSFTYVLIYMFYYVDRWYFFIWLWIDIFYFLVFDNRCGLYISRVNPFLVEFLCFPVYLQIMLFEGICKHANSLCYSAIMNQKFCFLYLLPSCKLQLLLSLSMYFINNDFVICLTVPETGEWHKGSGWNGFRYCSFGIPRLMFQAAPDAESPTCPLITHITCTTLLLKAIMYKQVIIFWQHTVSKWCGHQKWYSWLQQWNNCLCE